MRAINHTITGATIGALIQNPVIALPIALISHLVLDIIPHSGDKNINKGSSSFKRELVIDVILSSTFLMSIFILRPPDWQLLIACGMLAASPDLLWFPYWIKELRGQPSEYGIVGRFLSWIQWSEKPWGYIVEGFWLFSILHIFVSIIYA